MVTTRRYASITTRLYASIHRTVGRGWLLRAALNVAAAACTSCGSWRRAVALRWYCKVVLGATDEACDLYDTGALIQEYNHR